MQRISEIITNQVSKGESGDLWRFGIIDDVQRGSHFNNIDSEDRNRHWQDGWTMTSNVRYGNLDKENAKNRSYGKGTGMNTETVYGACGETINMVTKRFGFTKPNDCGNSDWLVWGRCNAGGTFALMRELPRDTKEADVIGRCIRLNIALWSDFPEN